MFDTVCALVIVLVLLLAFWISFAPSREHSDITAPSFNDSLVDKYRSTLKDTRGLTLNDYALESHITDLTPLSGDYKVL